MRNLLLLFSFLLAFQFGHANNVSISGISITPPTSGNFYTYINFTLSWENSWKSSVMDPQQNMDGVLVFFKYRTETGEWQNLNLVYENSFNPIDPSFEFLSFGSAKIIHRANAGTGNVSGQFQFSISPVIYDVEIRGFAIEMVNIPEYTNYLGDGNSYTASYGSFYRPGTLYATYNTLISAFYNNLDDEEIYSNYFSINAPNGLGDLPINNDNYPTAGEMWCMKYEISQGAYRDFLNTINYNQQYTRTANFPFSAIGTGALTTSGNNRNFIEIKNPGDAGIPAEYGCDASGNNVYDEANDGEFVACNYLSWPDIAAWLDWAGLAPMTEIQFEKICKNNYNNPPIAGEYAWESKLINSSALTLSNPFTQSELVSNSSTTLGNAIFYLSGLDGPVRNGIFSTATTTNRKKSGAAYYGVMDMSGNLSEACVTVGNVAGRSYNKLGLPGLSRGDGILSLNGNALVSYWPGNVAATTLETIATAEVTTGAGTINRGGSWNSGKEELSIADRSGGQVSTNRLATQGGRGVIVVSMY